MTLYHQIGNLSIPATTSKWLGGKWNTPDTYEGDGFSLEGKLVQVRNHSVADTTQRHTRYVAVVVDVTSARRRTFKDGEEVETQFDKHHLVGKGYLNKYDEKEVVDPHRVGNDALLAVGGGAHAIPDGLFDAGRSKLHPAVSGRFEFWCLPDTVKHIKLTLGEVVKLKTRGDTIFVFSIAPKTIRASNYAGEDVLGNWTDKIAAGKEVEEDAKPLPGDEKQGCDDDEWD
eukprot:TRINITY_DN12909_c0_g1_i1.p1 TRINITY_DN12909_c0_g1~~TRINITY_DN12909_c0_g1_i1.p1  ORF type:complete len:229 (-),score=53.77 TRINITY_DN12909_c0_g1_i1:57-743(-)